MSQEVDEKLIERKKEQCERITRYLTPNHHENVVSQVWALRRILESMPLQLYVQSVLMNELTAAMVEMTAMYFSQRRPVEIGKFKWKVDAKDPKKITTQEKWWSDTLGPFQETRSSTHPIGVVNDPGFNYKFFEKSYILEKEMWHPEKPRELVKGFNIKKILSDSISFEDSRSDVLLQAVDILTNFVRRVLMGRISDPAIVRTLGRLQIHRRQGGVDQSIALVTLTRCRPTGDGQLAGQLKLMSRAARSMIRKPVELG